jgi:hypothetical protein
MHTLVLFVDCVECLLDELQRRSTLLTCMTGVYEYTHIPHEFSVNRPYILRQVTLIARAYVPEIMFGPIVYPRSVAPDKRRPLFRRSAPHTILGHAWSTATHLAMPTGFVVTANQPLTTTGQSVRFPSVVPAGGGVPVG